MNSSGCPPLAAAPVSRAPLISRKSYTCWLFSFLAYHLSSLTAGHGRGGSWMAWLLRLVEAHHSDLEEVPGGVVVLPAGAQHRVSAGGGSEEPQLLYRLERCSP
jgi:hypothetical protein